MGMKVSAVPTRDAVCLAREKVACHTSGPGRLAGPRQTQLGAAQTVTSVCPCSEQEGRELPGSL